MVTLPAGVKLQAWRQLTYQKQFPSPEKDKSWAPNALACVVGRPKWETDRVRCSPGALRVSPAYRPPCKSAQWTKIEHTLKPAIRWFLNNSKRPSLDFDKNRSCLKRFYLSNFAKQLISFVPSRVKAQHDPVQGQELVKRVNFRRWNVVSFRLVSRSNVPVARRCFIRINFDPFRS